MPERIDDVACCYLGLLFTPGTIREGFSIQLTPRLLDDGRVMLQYSMSLVDIVKITTFGSIYHSRILRPKRYRRR